MTDSPVSTFGHYDFLRLEEERGLFFIPPQVERVQRDLLHHLLDDLFVAYVGGALTGVAEEVKQRYVTTKEIVERHHGFGYAPHINGTDPVKHPDVTPDDVRDIDEFWAVSVPDFQIQWTDPAAEGCGVEKGWAEAVNMVPVVNIYPVGKKPSRLVRGLRNVCYEISYGSLEEAYAKIDETAARIEIYTLQHPRIGRPSGVGIIDTKRVQNGLPVARILGSA